MMAGVRASEGRAEIAARGECALRPRRSHWSMEADRARQFFAFLGDNTGQDVWNSVDQG